VVGGGGGGGGGGGVCRTTGVLCTPSALHTSVYYLREAKKILYETLSSDASCVLGTHSYVQKRVASVY